MDKSRYSYYLRHFSRFFTVMFLFTITSIALSLLSNSSGSKRQTNDGTSYAVSFDAGSTGTRIYVVKFNYNPQNKLMPFAVENVTYTRISPGLSAYAQNPERVAHDIDYLLSTAKENVPKSYWKKTPITLKATAGLRLLEEDKAEALLEQVRKVLGSSEFLFERNSVKIMSGSEEGALSWYAIAVLLERMKIKGSAFSHVALDLGGASTQVTFMPSKSSKKHRIGHRTKFLHEITMFNTSLELYANSYLGNGLVTARIRTFQQSVNNDTMVSDCLPLDYLAEYSDFNNNSWNIRGSALYSYDTCKRAVDNYIVKSRIERILELNERDIFAFSFFHDVALHSGLIPPEDVDEYKIPLSTIKTAAEEACLKQADEIDEINWSEWRCFDLTYIHSLLSKGYGVGTRKTIHMVNRMSGFSVSWALGASYQLLSQHFKDVSTEMTSASGVVKAGWIYIALAPLVYNSLL